MPKSPTKKLSTQVCAWDECSAHTGFRKDGETPLKYCAEHTPLARKAFVENVIKPSAEARELRDVVFQEILDAAMKVGEEAREGANSLSASDGAHITFKPTNSAWVHFLRRLAIGDTVEGKGHVVRFPALPGAVIQARAVAEHLRPMTASGGALQGVTLTVS